MSIVYLLTNTVCVIYKPRKRIFLSLSYCHTAIVFQSISKKNLFPNRNWCSVFSHKLDDKLFRKNIIAKWGARFFFFPPILCLAFLDLAIFK